MDAKVDYVQRGLEGLFRSQARELAAALTRLERAERETSAAARWVSEAQEHFDQLRAAVIQSGGNTTPGLESLEKWKEIGAADLNRLDDRELLQT